MITDLILLILASLAIIIALISDIKTKEIPDFLSYSLIISGLSIRFLHAYTFNNYNYLTTAITNLAIFFIIGSLMYYTKQWGGGDAKLLMALSVLSATYPNFLLNYFKPALEFFSFPVTIFINIILVGAFYNTFYSIILSIKHRKEFVKEFRKIYHNIKTTRILFSILLLLLMLLYIITEKEPFQLCILIFFLAFLALFYLWIFTKTVEKSCMYKTIPISKLVEGDWVTKNIIYKGKCIYKKSLIGITKSQIEKIKKTNIKKVEIKEGIIFTPAFFIGFILSLIIGNPILYFL